MSRQVSRPDRQRGGLSRAVGLKRDPSSSVGRNTDVPSSADGYPVELPDEGVLAGLAAGDPAAARTLVARYQARVYGLALGVLRDRTAAEDVAQEAFVRA